jgi:hypothetical protein
VDAAAEDEASFARKNDAEMAENLSKIPAMSRAANTIKGYVMEQRDQSQPQNSSSGETVRTEVQALLVGAPVIALLIAWRWKRTRRGGR